MKQMAEQLKGIAKGLENHERRFHSGKSEERREERRGERGHERPVTQVPGQPRTLRGESDRKGGYSEERAGERSIDFGQLPAGWKDTGEAPEGDEFGQRTMPVQDKPLAAKGLSDFGGPKPGTDIYGGSASERKEERAEEEDEDEEGEEEEEDEE